MRPGPVLLTIGATSILADEIQVTYSFEPFDRVEFDNDKLKSAPLSTGAVPQLYRNVGGREVEILSSCATAGMIGSYTPRPVIPNTYPAGWNNIKQRINIKRYTVKGGTSPETVSAASNVESILGLSYGHIAKIQQFQNRLAIFSGNIYYEQLISAQVDNIQTLYFTTGIGLTGPGISESNIMVLSLNEGLEFAIPNGLGGFTRYKSYDAIFEVRTVTSASA